MSASASFPSRLFLLAVIIAGLVHSGCETPQRAPDRVGLDSGAVVTSADLLSRVVEAHRRATSIRAVGLLRDFRRGADREVPISWQLARPERCKLQIDMDVAIVLGEQWWTYRPVVGRYTSHRPFTTTPIETAATLISDGVPFLMPLLFNQGAAALGAGADGLFPEWRLKGATFQAGRPCYLFERLEPGPDNHGFLRMLIDQESLLLRGWTLGRSRPDGSERILVEVTYYEIVANAPIPRDAFDARPPAPILLPADAATGESR